jgi:CRP-like cAMP-binding protein
MSRATPPAPVVKPPAIDWAGIHVQRIAFAAGATIFNQGDPAASVMYIAQGSVRLSVLSHTGKEAVIAVLAQDYFFGEGCLAGQPRRMATASALTACQIVVVEKPDIVRHLISTRRSRTGS